MRSVIYIYIYICICKSCGYNVCSGSEFVWSVWNMIEVTLRWADMAEIVENLRQKMTFQVLNMFLQYMYKSRLRTVADLYSVWWWELYSLNLGQLILYANKLHLHSCEEGPIDDTVVYFSCSHRHGLDKERITDPMNLCKNMQRHALFLLQLSISTSNPGE